MKVGAPRGRLVVVGAGGHARPVVDAAMESGWEVVGILDVDYSGEAERILARPVLGGLEILARPDHENTHVIVAIGDGKRRAKLYDDIACTGRRFASVVHPTAIVSLHARVGDGTFVNAGAIVNAGVTIGQDCIINTGAIVDHECAIGRHAHVGPGVRLGGRVRVGDYSFLGIGATVIDKIVIGSEAIVGAGSVVIRNVEQGATVVGVPAARIR